MAVRRSLTRLVVPSLLVLAACGSDGGTPPDDVTIETHQDVAADATPQEALDTTDVAPDEAATPPDAGEMVATIHADRTKGNAPLTVKFTGDVQGCAVDDADYLWTFGPGTYSQKKDPGDFIFHVEGVYNVKFDVHCRTGDLLASDTVQVVVRGSAELALSKVLLTSPNTVAPGDALLFTFDVFNRGDQIEEPFKVLIILSKDEVYQPDKDLVLRELTIDSMADGRYSEVKQSYVSEPAPLPPDTAEGSYFLFVAVDPDDVVTESNEENNVAQATSFISVKLAAKEKPDLTISKPDFASGTKVAPGKAFSYSVTLSNIGQKPAKNFRFGVFGSTDANWSPDDPMLSSEESATVYNLEPGKPLTMSAVLLIPADMAPGLYNAIAVADTTDAIYESDETNNVAVADFPFEVIDEAVHGFDLAVESIAVTPHDTYFGGSIKVVATLANSGDKATPKFPVSYFISKEPSVNPNYDDKLAELSIASLGAGESMELTQVVNIPSGPQYAGEFYVSVVVDVKAQLDELDETNNWKLDPAPIHIYKDAFVDVGLSALVFHPAVVAAGKEIKVAYTMKNTGSTTSGAFVNYVVLSPDKTVSMADVQAMKDYVVGKVTIDPISPSASVDRVEKVPVPIALPHDVGEYFVGVIGDALGSLTVDTNKSNQTLVSDSVLAVLGPQGGCFEDAYEPNNDAAGAKPLAPNGGELGPFGLCGGEDWFAVEVAAGQSLIVQMSVESPLYLEPRPFDLDLQILGPDGKAIDTATSTGPIEKAAAFAVATGGTYDLRVYPKSTGTQAHYRLDVSVVDPSDGVDLTPFHVTVVPDAIYPGGLVAISAIAANLGGADAPASEVLAVLSKDAVPDDGDLALATFPVAAIPAASKADIKVTVKLPTDVAGGDYYVLLVADPSAVIAETDESNNVGVSGKVVVDESMVCLDDAFEPNDSLELATPIAAASQAYPGLEVCPDLPDVYRVELPVGVSFQVAVTYDQKADKGFVAIDVMDASGALLDAVPTSKQPVAGLPYVFSAGTYYVRVRVNPSAGKAGPYTYSMAVSLAEPFPGDVCAADGREPNNGFDETSGIGCGVNHLTLCKKDRDFYKVALAQGAALSLTLSQSKAELKASVYTDPKASAVKTITGNGSVDYVATSDVVAWVVVEPKSAVTGVTVFDYALTVSGVPGTDVAVGPVKLVPTEVYQGDDVQMSFTLSNGCQEPAGAFDLEAFLSVDAVLDPSDVPLTLAHVPGGLDAMTDLDQVIKGMIPLDTAPGKYRILVQADPGGAVAESQEDNNVAAAPVSVAKLCLNDPLEPNDAAGSAALVGPGTYFGLVICPWDVDWVRFHAVAGSTIVVTMAAPIAAGDLDLRLYAASDPAKPVAVSATQSDVEVVSHAVAADGDFLVRVNGFLGDSAAYDMTIATAAQ
jgi:uncharacterized membrane protein